MERSRRRKNDLGRNRLRTNHRPLYGSLYPRAGHTIYCGNFLAGNLKGKAGKTYVNRGDFCLETQHYPDSPNQPDFPSTLLSPGEEYKTTTLYKFSSK
jgi:galactose mutarotase-like enzyme